LFAAYAFLALLAQKDNRFWLGDTVVLAIELPLFVLLRLLLLCMLDSASVKLIMRCCGARGVRRVAVVAA
jgi:hypothetical protein